MGLEQETNVVIAGKSAACKVLLEPGEIILRGGFKRRISLSEISGLQASDGELRFEHAGTAIAIELGSAAAKWMDRILNPRSRSQKLGLKPGMQVCLVGSAEADVWAEVQSATGKAPKTRLTPSPDLVLFFVEDAKDLQRLDAISASIEIGGAIWVLFPKGRRDLSHEVIVAAAKEHRLSLSKSVGFSERLTGIRLSRAKSLSS